MTCQTKMFDDPETNALYESLVAHYSAQLSLTKEMDAPVYRKKEDSKFFPYLIESVGSWFFGRDKRE